MKNRIALLSISLLCAACAPPNFLYKASTDPMAASLRVTTTTDPATYNTWVYISDGNTKEPTPIGVLNSRMAGTEWGIPFLDTKIPGNETITISVFSAIKNDIGMMDALLESKECLLKNITYCRVSATFTPQASGQYSITQNADLFPCHIEVNEKKGGSIGALSGVTYAHASFDAYQKPIEFDINECYFDKNKESNKQRQRIPSSVEKK